MARLILPYQQVFDLNGSPLPGAKMYFYESGTVTPKDTYSDEALTIPNTNPVIADSQGQFGDIFLNGNYSCKLTDTDDVTQPDYPAEITAVLDTASAVLLIGNQTVAGVKTFTDRLAVKADNPIVEIEENDAAANNRIWQATATAEKYIQRVSNDARDSFTNYIEVDRTDNTVDSIALTATSVKANGIDIVPLDEDDMVSDSDTRTATQQSIKAYVDTTVDTTAAEPRHQIFDSSGTFTVPSGITAVLVVLVGGGGGGGGGAVGVYGGGGAGGDIVNDFPVTGLTPGGTETITIGGGGTGGAGGGGTGGAGNTTSFGSHISGAGGTGGATGAGGGADGDIGGGSGGDGESGSAEAGTGASYTGGGGAGGGSSGGGGGGGGGFGTGGAGGVFQAVGVAAGDNTGAGGGGAGAGSNNRAGGNGGSGKLIVKW